MSKDLAKILEGWEYQPEEVQVRIVLGDDGRNKIQLRIDMGLLQMEMDGRPDGAHPEGCESWLDYYLHKQQEHDAAHPDAGSFELEELDCFRLWREGVQYYHRYLGFWHLKLYDRCARDTARNLRLFAFVKGHAQGDRNKMQFDQWRPYVTMMHTRAVATPQVEKQEYSEVLRTIHTGIDAIRDFLEEYGQTDRADQCPELLNLERWRDEVELLVVKSGVADDPNHVELLRRKLKEAVAAEQFEEAAQLRDEIRRLTG